MGNTRNNHMTGKSARPDFNYQMCILSVIGIFFVMLGHLKNDFSSTGTFYGWFPYYSFHMPLFIFISGYFFRDRSEEKFSRSFPAFLWKKVKTLLIPYYLINGCFLLIQTILHQSGIYLGAPFTLSNWLLQPWISPEPFTFSHPTWFLMALFLSEIYFFLVRKLFALFIKKELVKEIVLSVFTVVLSCLMVFAIDRYSLQGTVIVYIRSAYLMFYLQLGRLYRQYLEKRDTLPGKFYFPIIFVIQLIIIIRTINSPLYHGYVLMQWFGRTGIVSLLSGMTGIALWLRISRIISTIPNRNRLVLFIGDNTKYIMSFHLFGYFLVNTLFYFMQGIRDIEVFIPDFDKQRFLSEVYYACEGNPRLILLYFAAGLAVSLLLAKLIGGVQAGFRKLRSR